MASSYTRDPTKDIESILRQHDMEKWHLCTACGSQYSNRDDLIDHMQSHDPTDGRECTITKATITSRSSRDKSVMMSRKLIVIAHDWKVRSIPDGRNFENQWEPHPENPKSFSCNECGKSYEKRLQLAIHDFCHRSYGKGCLEGNRSCPPSSTGEKIEYVNSTPSELFPGSSRRYGRGILTKKHFSNSENISRFRKETESRTIEVPGSSRFEPSTSTQRDKDGVRNGGNASAIVKIGVLPPKPVEVGRGAKKTNFEHRRSPCTCVMCDGYESVPSEIHQDSNLSSEDPMDFDERAHHYFSCGTGMRKRKLRY